MESQVGPSAGPTMPRWPAQETVFSRPGVGRLIVGGILNKDFPLVQGTILFVATAYVLINLLVDLSYAVLDPRIRLR